MFVTCRARYVRRTLARPRTRPQRPAAVSYLVLPAGKLLRVARAFSLGLAPRNGLRSPGAARGVVAWLGFAALVGQGEGTMRAPLVSCWTHGYASSGRGLSVGQFSARWVCLGFGGFGGSFSRLHFLGSTAVLEEEETGQWTITAWF